MMNSNKKLRVYDLVLIFVGSIITLFGTVISELWLIPAKQHKLHQTELIENRLSKLYTPLIIATGKGQFSMTSDIVFYRVYEIMESYGYLADKEIVDKYIEFIDLCRFADYNELKEGASLPMPLSNDIIIEIIKQRKPPLKWTSESLRKALHAEKRFIRLLLKHYNEAQQSFSIEQK